MNLAQAINPFAPPAVEGIGQQDAGFIDVDYTYTYDVTTLVGVSLRDQQVPISQDADFYLRAVHYSQQAGFVGAFNYRLADAQGYQMSSGMITNGNLSNSAARPTVVFPEHMFPAGSRIIIDFDNVAGVEIRTQICFKGVKRYRLRK